MGYIAAGLNEDGLNAWDGSTAAEPGEYRVAIKSVELQSSKAAGHPMIQVDFEIISNANGEASDQAGGTVKKWYVFGSKTGKNRLMSLLRAVGLQFDDEGGFDTDALVGQQLLVSVVRTSYTSPDIDTGEQVTKPGSDLFRERAVMPLPTNGTTAPEVRA